MYTISSYILRSALLPGHSVESQSNAQKEVNWIIWDILRADNAVESQGAVAMFALDGTCNYTVVEDVSPGPEVEDRVSL